MKINGKTVKLTIDSSWKWCMKMWRHVDKRCDEIGVKAAKKEFCEKHNITKLDEDCFFCEYVEQKASGCFDCPPTEIDKDFNCCTFGTAWDDNPHEFYDLLKELNKKRKK